VNLTSLFSAGNTLMNVRGPSNSRPLPAGGLNYMKSVAALQTSFNALGGNLHLNVNLACPCLCFGNNGSISPPAYTITVASQNIERPPGNPLIDWENNLKDIATLLADTCEIYPSDSERSLDQLFFASAIAVTDDPVVGPIVGTRGIRLRSAFGVNSAAFLDPSRVGTDAWLRESSYYDCVKNICVNGPCNHFVQAVGSKVVQTGCAVANCTTNSPFGSVFGNLWYHYLCVYNSPPGTVFTRPFPASQC